MRWILRRLFGGRAHCDRDEQLTVQSSRTAEKSEAVLKDSETTRQALEQIRRVEQIASGGR